MKPLEHYERPALIPAIVEALRQEGKDPLAIQASDLGPIDQLHIGGSRESVELLGLSGIGPGMRVLDVGCGLGGPARLLAEHGCSVLALDFTRTYAHACQELSAMVGFGRRVQAVLADATCLSIRSESVDAVWMEHVNMNISDKRALLSEILRVVRPGGRLAFHEVFQGSGGEVVYPMPWSPDAASSHLVRREVFRSLLVDCGWEVLEWKDRREESLAWLAAARRKALESGPRPLGPQIVLGPQSREILGNLGVAVEEQRIEVVMGVVRRPYLSL